MYSTADAQVCQATRTKAVAKIRADLDQLVRSVNDGRRNTDAASVARRVTRLFGRRRAAAYFHWELQALTAAGQAALPTPTRGCRRPSHRFVYHLDEAAAEADTIYDGLSVLVTTAARYGECRSAVQ